MAQAARRKRKTKKKRGAGDTGHAWGMLLVGLVCGAVLSGLYFGYQENEPGRFGSGIASLLEKKEKNEPEPQAEATEAEKPVEKEPEVKLDYEYYNRLPRIDDLIASSDIVADQEPVEDRSKDLYILQAGAYKDERDAESIKAKLALSGFESVIQRTVSGNETYYRVRLGPYEGRRSVEVERKRLAKQGFEAMALRLKPPEEQARHVQ